MCMFENTNYMYILKINCNMNTLIELYVKGSPMSMILQNMFRMADYLTEAG